MRSLGRINGVTRCHALDVSGAGDELRRKKLITTCLLCKFVELGVGL
jgi:hypothetical protein